MTLSALVVAAPLQLAWTAPPAPDSHFSRAVEKYGSRDWSAATKHFEQFLAANPDSSQAPEATYWLGEALLQSGRLDEAERAYKRLIDKWPTHRWARESWFRRGELAFWAGRSDDARQWLERFVDGASTSPRRFYALVYLAETAVEREDLPEVETLRKQFLESERGNGGGLHVLRPAIDRAWGKALLQAGQYESAAQVFATKPLNAPEDAYYRGVALLGLKQFEEAERCTARVWTDELPSELRPRLLILRASILIELARDDDAARVLDEYLETTPAGRDSLWARQQRLQIPLRQGRMDEIFAQWFCGGGCELPADERGRMGLLLAEAAFAQGDPDKARGLYRTIVADAQLSPVQASAQAGLGWIELRAERFQEARDAFAQCLASRPANAQVAEATFGLGQACERLGDADAALAAYQKAAARPATEVHVGPALMALARMHVRRGELERAEAMYRRLVEGFPQIRQRDEALYNWSWTLADLARRDDAARVWQRLTAEFPESSFAADARLRLAEDAHRRRQPREARRWLDELLARKTDNALAEHAVYLRGRLAADAGDWAELEADMRKLCNANTSPELKQAAEYWVAEALYRRDAWHESLEIFTRLDERHADRKSLAPDSAPDSADDAWLAVIPLRRAQLLARQARWSEAECVVASARERYAGFRFAYEWDFIEAQCHAALDRPAEARRAWERVVRSPSGGRTETAAAAQWQIGQSWQLEGNLTAAAEAYAALEKLFPKSPWRGRAMLGRAQCLELQRDWESAVRAYAAVLQEFPQGTWSEQAEAGLREARRSALRAR